MPTATGRRYRRQRAAVGPDGGRPACAARREAPHCWVKICRYNRPQKMVPERTELQPAVALFRCMADPTRLAIVRRIAATGEARVADLMKELELPQSTVSSHLGLLRECELVVSRPEGRQVFYALTRPELLDLLLAAEALLDATGKAVVLRPTSGEPAHGPLSHRDRPAGTRRRPAPRRSGASDHHLPMTVMSRLVPIRTPLTREVAQFVGRLQSKGSAVARVDEPQVFRQAIRVEARRRGVRVRTGTAAQDPQVVWACDPNLELSEEEYARENRRAVNRLGALLRAAGSMPETE